MVTPAYRRAPGRAAALAAVALSVAETPARGIDPCLAALVTRHSPLSAEDLARVEHGDIVLDDLPTAETRQVGIVGLARVRAPIGVVRDSLAAVRPMVGGEYLVGFGRFGAEPSVTDLAAYRMPQSDTEVLSSCVIGDCRVKITLDLLRAYGALPWRGRGVPQGIDDAARGWMTGYLADYLHRGAGALVVFRDKPQAQSLDDGFRDLATASPLLVDGLPDLVDYLTRYPDRRLPGVTDRFTWSLQDFGLRPTTIMSHTVVQDRPGLVPQVVVVRKQLYASHYLHAALTVVALVEGAPGAEPGTYLIYYDHYLFDDDVGIVRRLLAARRLQGYLGRRLEDFREAVEAGAASAEAGEWAPEAGAACPFISSGGA